MIQDGTSILFGLRGVKVRGVDRNGGTHLRPDVEGSVARVEGDGGRVVHVLTDDPSEGACPVCGVLSTSVRQRRTTRPRDLPYGEEALVVRWHKTQWTCRVAPPATLARLDIHRRFNGRLEHLRGSALGFRNLTNYIARSLLETGGFRPRIHPLLR